ncbi:COG1361 family protein [Streptomyces sp. S6]
MNFVSAGRSRRIGARAVLAASLALSAFTAVPAQADEQTDQLWINAPSARPVTVVSAGREALAQPLPVVLYHDNDNFTVTDGTLTVDASGLAGVAEVLWPHNCTPTGAKAVCEVGDVPVISGEIEPQVGLQVRALAGAAIGASGRITYEAEATGGPDGKLVAPRNSFDTTVTVGSGPDLSVPYPAELKGVQPGTTVVAPFTVTNKGDETAHGFTAQLWVTHGLDLATSYPECVAAGAGDSFVVHYTCAFDTVVEPGRTVGLPQPLKITATPHALYDRVDFSVQPTGGQTELEPMDNGASWEITAENKADFAVSGAYGGGAVGETVAMDVRLTNNGPGWVGYVGSGDPVAVLDVRLPAGTTAVSVPAGCRPRSDGYACRADMYIKSGASAAFPFKVRVDSVVPGAQGRVTARPPFGEGFSFDPDLSNNSATF